MYAGRGARLLSSLVRGSMALVAPRRRSGSVSMPPASIAAVNLASVLAVSCDRVNLNLSERASAVEMAPSPGVGNVDRLWLAVDPLRDPRGWTFVWLEEG